jgi:hypothetical protein
MIDEDGNEITRPNYKAWRAPLERQTLIAMVVAVLLGGGGGTVLTAIVSPSSAAQLEKLQAQIDEAKEKRIGDIERRLERIESSQKRTEKMVGRISEKMKINGDDD